jgi:hypothetical protein
MATSNISVCGVYMEILLSTNTSVLRVYATTIRLKLCCSLKIISSFDVHFLYLISSQTHSTQIVSTLIKPYNSS